MKNLIRKIEESKITFGYSILLFCFAIFLRTFLENFTNSNNEGKINGFVDTFLHYPLWFSSIFLGIIIIVSFFSEKHISKIFKVVSFGSFIIVLPPILDLIIYGYKIPYNFIIGDKIEISRQYLTLFLNTPSLGAGIKIEVVIILLSIFTYVYYQNKHFVKALLAAFFSYTLIFSMLCLPNFIYVLNSIFISIPNLSLFSVQHYFFNSSIISDLYLSRTYLSETISGNISSTINQNMFSMIMSQVSLLFVVFFSTITGFLYFGKNRFVKIIKNFRFLRIIHYFILIILGIMFGAKFLGFKVIFNLFDWLSVASLFLSIFFAWLFAVWENDEADKVIDILSSPERPLANNIFSEEEWKNLKRTFFVYSILFALLAGYTALIMILVYIIIYHIYSMPPLRLKKYPVISSILIGSNACLAFLLGFSFIIGNQPFNVVPVKVLLGILVFYSCVENIKNLKDIEGDKAEGMLTIPVIFGDMKGKFITWILVLVGTFAVPFLIFTDNNAFLLAPVLGAVSYFFIVKKEYKEKPLFLYYLISFLLLIILNFK